MSTMDDDEQLADSREQLLQTFRDSLSKPMSDRYFDEDDLIEIFDYAGDTGDDFLRMEALMCGARFHPDSEELLARRAIFYSQYSDAARQEFFKHSAPEEANGPEALIFDILELRANYAKADSAQVRNRLTEMLEKRESLADEEVIQLLEAASDMGQFEWIKASMPELRKKATYLTGLLYEAGMAAETAGDPEFAAKALEELTMIEPFNSYYWMLLSRQYADLEDADKALSALDYSLAINPQSPHSLLLKARFVHALEHPLDEVISLAEKAIEASKGATDAVRFLASVYHKEGNDDKAREVISQTLGDPEMGMSLPLFGNADTFTNKETELIPDLVLYGQPNPGRWLDAFFNANEENSQFMWASWATQLAEEGREELATEVLQCFERNSGIKTPSMLSVEVPLRNQHYGAVLHAIKTYLSDTQTGEIDSPELMALHMITLMRLGQKGQAQALGEFILKTCIPDAYPSISKKLELAGLRAIVQQALDIIAADDSSSITHFDPLGIWG